MSPYDFYITPEEYETAASNGISRHLLSSRIRQYGWDKQRALSESPKVHQERKLWAEIAKQNGISYGAFVARVNQYGWDEKRAATTPLQDRRALACAAIERNRKIIPLALVKRAEESGISYQTLRKRIVVCGWDMEEAATRQIMTRQERGKLGKKAYELNRSGGRKQGEPKILL